MTELDRFVAACERADLQDAMLVGAIETLREHPGAQGRANGAMLWQGTRAALCEACRQRDAASAAWRASW